MGRRMAIIGRPVAKEHKPARPWLESGLGQHTFLDRVVHEFDEVCLGLADGQLMGLVRFPKVVHGVGALRPGLKDAAVEPRTWEEGRPDKKDLNREQLRQIPQNPIPPASRWLRSGAV